MRPSTHCRCLLILPALAAVTDRCPAQSTAPATLPAPWLAVDSAGRTATITLEVTAPRRRALGAASTATGKAASRSSSRSGGPSPGTGDSADSAGKHSLVVMAEREKLPTEGGGPASPTP